MPTARSALIVIGGNEDKKDTQVILRAVAARVGKGKLCIVTAASRLGDVLWEEYRRVFRKLGVRRITHLDFQNRKEWSQTDLLEGVTVVFFTGGSQLKITSGLGGTPVEDRIREIYHGGGTIAGTSAGAAVMGDVMLVSGEGSSSFRVGGRLRMAPGLSFIPGVLVDQHFAERGRIGRLVGALAHNPRVLGIGLDENTAFIMEGKSNEFRVLGEGSMYVIDAHSATESNLYEADPDAVLSLFNLKLHLLSHGDLFNYKTRSARLIQIREEEPSRSTIKKRLLEQRKPVHPGVRKNLRAKKDRPPRTLGSRLH